MTHATLKSIVLAMIMAGASPDLVMAQERSDEIGRPDPADLRMHVRCAELATLRILSIDEATVCGLAYLRIKLAFVPDLDLRAYGRLSASERAAVNLRGYRGYLVWSEANFGRMRDLTNETRAALATETE